MHKLKALTKILLAVGLFLAAFVIAMIVLFCVYGFTPDVLIQCVLGAGLFEAVLCAAIKCVNVCKGHKEESDDVSYDI